MKYNWIGLTVAIAYEPVTTTVTTRSSYSIDLGPFGTQYYPEYSYVYINYTKRTAASSLDTGTIATIVIACMCLVTFVFLCIARPCCCCRREERKNESV